jgi:hypothetical protein
MSASRKEMLLRLAFIATGVLALTFGEITAAGADTYT